MNVRCQIVDDSDEALISLLDRLLENGGCVGVICDTVGRAQHAAKLLGDYFGSEYVKLTHSRFMDIDRMSNEAELRQLLGPDSTVGNGGRPQRMIVVGTQVLEQSLDIDFDALVTDIAPVDLIMQRLGRYIVTGVVTTSSTVQVSCGERRAISEALHSGMTMVPSSLRGWMRYMTWLL